MHIDSKAHGDTATSLFLEKLLILRPKIQLRNVETIQGLP